MNTINTRIHALFDYLAAGAMISIPWIFYTFSHTTAYWSLIIPGTVLLLYTVVTDFEYGIIRVLPVKVHLFLDGLLGVFLMVSPWAFGFYSETFLFHILFGAVLLILSFFTPGISLSDKKKVKEDNRVHGITNEGTRIP